MQMQPWDSQLAMVILKRHLNTKVITANPDKQRLRSSIFRQCQFHAVVPTKWLSRVVCCHMDLPLSPRQLAIPTAQLVEHVWLVGLPHWESANATEEM